jgi:hypothetical protein
MARGGGVAWGWRMGGTRRRAARGEGVVHGGGDGTV